MRYIVKGIEVRSENVAKSIKEVSRPLVEWLKNRDMTDTALDYGCGKLRYTKFVAMKSLHLGIVDSKLQLDRSQQINGLVTTVRRYAESKWPECKIYDLETFFVDISDKYDFILCSNVLSAIPCPKVRAKSLRALHNSLSPKGTMLVLNQHTNSYFKEVRTKAGTIEHLNGWLLNSHKGGAYYGILNKETTIRLLERFTYRIKDAWIEGQSNYVLVEKGKSL